jgi:hypothetical protein
MRLGVLGPAEGDLPALARAAQRLLDVDRADRVLYLSDDDALDLVVASWARELVGSDPSEKVLYDRAAARCGLARPAQIDAFVAQERARHRLKVFASLPAAPQRTIEILDGRVVLFVFDKATLDEEDIAAASVLVFGKSTEPLLRRVGSRTFLSPGPIASPHGGRALLDDSDGGMRVRILDASGSVVAEDMLAPARAGAKMKVQGDLGRS